MLNNITIKDRTPLPCLSSMKDDVREAKHFSKLDIKNAFPEIAIKKEDQFKTAFRTRYGLFEYTCAPFGFCNSPAVFIRFMNRIFCKLVGISVLIFVDDILVYSKNEEDHVEHMKEVLEILELNNLTCPLEKCEFNKPEMIFCGIKFTQTGTAITSEAAAALVDYPTIKSVTELQSFLGSIRFWADHIPYLAEIASELFDLTKPKSGWDWNINHQSNIRVLQFYMLSDKILKYFNPSDSLQMIRFAKEKQVLYLQEPKIDKV